MPSNKKKKKNKLGLILSIAWVLFVVIRFYITVTYTGINRDFTTFNDAARSEERVYIADNNVKGGLVYELDLDGNVKGLFATQNASLFTGWEIHKVCYGDNTPFCLMDRPAVKDGRETTEYQIVRFNPELGTTHRSPVFRLDSGLRVTGFTEFDEIIYMTALSSSGQQAAAFRIDTDELVRITNTNPSPQEQENFASLSIQPVLITTQVAPAGRFYTQAEYHIDTLYTRDDSQSPEENFTLDSDAATLYEKRIMDFGNRLTVSGVSVVETFVTALIGVLLIQVVTTLLKGRRRIAYAMVTYEVIVALVVAGAFCFIAEQEKKISIEAYERFEQYSLGNLFDVIPEGFDYMLSSGSAYDDPSYAVLQNRIADQIESSGKTVRMLDICVVNQSDGMVAISGSGRNRQPVNQLYGREALAVVGNVHEQDDTALGSGIFQGENISFMAKYLADERVPGYVVLGVTAYSNISGEFFSNRMNVIMMGVLVFIVASILGAVYFYAENYDLMGLSAALRDLASRRDKVEKPPVLGNDMNYMWNSIFEIQKYIRASNRIKYLTYEAYYRFAPKGIEKILSKDSITEVKSGDAIGLNGTMALVANDRSSGYRVDELALMNRHMESLSERLKQEEGIFISNDCNLSMMKVLFLEDNRRSCAFSIGFIDNIRAMRSSDYTGSTILMHYFSFVYGIAGTMEQAFTYLSSKETELMEKYVRWFESMRLSLIITEDVKEREGADLDLRYIGFIIPEGLDKDSRINMYEVLDACSVRERAMKLELEKQMQDALLLYYSEDFYFARNAFSDILKEMPHDDIAKWYLFECERCLNEIDNSDFTGALHF